VESLFPDQPCDAPIHLLRRGGRTSVKKQSSKEAHRNERMNIFAGTGVRQSTNIANLPFSCMKRTPGGISR